MKRNNKNNNKNSETSITKPHLLRYRLWGAKDS